MRCLCCGKEIGKNASHIEMQNRWHNKCVRSFFGTNEMPKLDITDKQLNKLVNETINQGLTVTGVQKKLSIHLSDEDGIKLTIVDYPTGYILKPQTEEYDSLPEFEDMAMRMAEACGIQTVPHALIKMKDRYAYITKRVDRNIEKDEVSLYAMEDFCQLSNRQTRDKYRGSYENCGKIIKKYSVRSGFDLSELFLRIVFSFVTGNSDMHLKNFSLRETESKSRIFCLSEAYDMLPVGVILPEDEEEMALTLNGKKRNIRKRDFLILAEKCDISKKAAENMLEKVCSKKDDLLEICNNSYLSDGMKGEVSKLITERIKKIE